MEFDQPWRSKGTWIVFKNCYNSISNYSDKFPQTEEQLVKQRLSTFKELFDESRMALDEASDFEIGDVKMNPIKVRPCK